MMKKTIAALAAMLAAAMLLAGCSLSSIVAEITGSPVSRAERGPVQDTIVGTITEISGAKLTVTLLERIDASSEAESSEAPVSEAASSGASSKKSVSSQLTMDWFDLSLYAATERTMELDLGSDPCILIPDGAGGWTSGTMDDLMVGDTIVRIDDYAAGEGVWRIAAVERTEG